MRPTDLLPSHAPINLAMDFPLLSPREREVGALVVCGRGSKQIGESLGISPRTVDDHREKFFRKIGVTSVAHACWIVFGRPVVTA